MARAPACGLCLVLPAAIPDARAFLPGLLAALSAGPVSSLILPGSAAAAAPVLFPPVQERGVACLIAGSPALVSQTAADGVHLDGADGAAVRNARRLLGPDLIVGAGIGVSRHGAMEAAEAGADYVAIGPSSGAAIGPATASTSPSSDDETALLDWWQSVMEVPCVAMDGGRGPAEAAALVEAGADFLAVSQQVWTHPDGPGAGVGAFVALLG